MNDGLRLTALEALQSAADRAKRTGNVRFPLTFVRSQYGDPALARLIQGGQGGRIRLPLYLDIVMMATSYPHVLTENSLPPAAWCKMLGLPDDIPRRRRVSSNLKLLARDKVLSLEQRPSQTPIIRLLDPLDSQKSLSVTGGRYVGIPIEFWTRGWILDLSPTAIAVLFALSELLGGREKPQYISKRRRETYGLSTDTWTKGPKELEGHGLIIVERGKHGTGSDLPRLRNTYWINRSVILDPRQSTVQKLEVQ